MKPVDRQCIYVVTAYDAYYPTGDQDIVGVRSSLDAAIETSVDTDALAIVFSIDKYRDREDLTREYRDRRIRDAAGHWLSESERERLSRERQTEWPEICPIGHDGARRLRHEEIGDVERCLRCDTCPATYVRVGGRWWEVSS